MQDAAIVTRCPDIVLCKRGHAVEAAGAHDLLVPVRAVKVENDPALSHGPDAVRRERGHAAQMLGRP